MAYIRCGSNPESLYVWGDVSGGHFFSWTDLHGELQQFSVPDDVFVEFFKKFREWDVWEDFGGEHDLGDGEIFEYEGMKLQEVRVSKKNKRPLTEKEKNKEEEETKLWNHEPTDHLICLSYKDDAIYMWEVTWDRLRDSAYHHIYTPHWLIRKLSRWFPPKFTA